MDKTVIARVQSFGFDVYMRNPDDSWLLFTDGTRIGYLQKGRFGGFALSSVHKANKTSGTGYSINPEAADFDKTTLETCFVHAPHWAGDDSRAATVKWRDMATFLKADSFNGGYQLVAPIEADMTAI